MFSIGNLKPLFQAVWPTCWKTHEECSANWLDAITYLEILGIICGQVMVGFLGDGMSRKWGLVQDATIMTIGCALLTGVWGVTLNGWVIAYAWSLFIYSSAWSCSPISLKHHADAASQLPPPRTFSTPSWLRTVGVGGEYPMTR